MTLKRSLKVIQSGIVLCEQPTRELFAIAKFLFSIVTVALSSVVSHAHSQTLVKNLEIYIPNVYSTLPRQWPRFRKDVYYWDNWAILCGKSMMMMLSRFDTDQSVVDGRTDGHICTFSILARQHCCTEAHKNTPNWLYYAQCMQQLEMSPQPGLTVWFTYS